MNTIKMDCGCYLSGHGFKIEGGNLYKIEAYSEDVIFWVELTDAMVERLEDIKERYSYMDVNRTAEVLLMLDEIRWGEFEPEAIINYPYEED